MTGVVTHIPDLKISTACTTALKNIPNTLVFAPSLTNIIDHHTQLFLTFYRLPTTAGQFSPDAIMI